MSGKSRETDQNGLGMGDKERRRLPHDRFKGGFPFKSGAKITLRQDRGHPQSDTARHENTAGCAENKGQITREAPE